MADWLTLYLGIGAMFGAFVVYCSIDKVQSWSLRDWLVYLVCAMAWPAAMILVVLLMLGLIDRKKGLDRDQV